MVSLTQKDNIEANVVLYPVADSPSQDREMDRLPSKFESLLEFLAEWEAEQGTSFWGLVTAGQLADVQELERMFALPTED